MTTKSNRALKTLILTDSDTKARTMRRLIGRQYTIESTTGFLRDLPKTQIGIDPDNNFELKVITVRGKAQLLKQLQKETFDALRIYLATEPDYEGEAFAAHYCELFGVNPESKCRVELRAMTKDALRQAIHNARPIDKCMVEAYWTRRLVNRFTSFNLNPYLWCAVWQGLSLNNMQLLVLRLLCRAEEHFEPRDLDKPETMPIDLKSLQLWAARDLKFSAGRMVLLARELYEGVSLGRNFSGVISYIKDEPIEPLGESPDELEPFLNANQLKVYRAIWERKIPFASEYQLPEKPTDLSLMLELERLGVNWADMYSASINTLIKNGFVERTEQGYASTDIGREVLSKTDAFFADTLNVKFFVELEEKLRAVAKGELTRLEVLKHFYAPFGEALSKAMKSLGDNPKPKDPPIVESDQICEKCGRRMVIKRGRYGKFLACPGYPECKNTMPYFKYLDDHCPKCVGRLVMRFLTKSRTFYGCEHYPECGFGTWDVPQDKKCSACGSVMLLHRFKGRQAMLYCSNEKCPTRVDHPINRILEKARLQIEERKRKKSDANE